MEKTILQNLPFLPRNYATISFGRKLDYRRELDNFINDSKTQKVLVDIKCKRSPLAEIKKTLKLYGGKIYYTSFWHNQNYADHALELFFQ